MSPTPSLVDRVVDLLLPPLCLHCAARLATARPAVCGACLDAIVPVPAAGCRRCGLPRPGGPETCGRCRDWPPGLEAVAATRYDGVARTLVAGLKYSGWRHLAEPCADRMAAALAGRGVDLLVPVPLHAARLRERGFNQSRVLAEALATRTGIPVEDALTRQRRTGSQVGRDRAARRANVRGAFATAGTRRLEGRTVALIDDVATSGSTLAAAAEPLLASGARAVVGLAFGLAFEGGRG